MCKFKVFLGLFLAINLISSPVFSEVGSEIAARGGGGGERASGMDRMNSNQMYSGNAFDRGQNANSNEMYSGNRAGITQQNSNNMYSGNALDRGQNANSNSMYSGNAGDYNSNARNNGNYYRQIDPNYNSGGVDVAPGYGYGYGAVPMESNAQIFPDETEANNLYWSEVQKMENN